ncbi:hypothetical protein AYY26_17350 [Photobacterium phosphoreum]|uniref:hypothetical protein n=1 Tax=Photobacterium phosphoreum TaxID=659 RepID=UPI0007F9492C|nr:hypothetical protein [Photobacterium phosphoreum]OBU44479.1 hypothetical protein AYY26_17350 [Photobacterium phosphoreum]
MSSKELTEGRLREALERLLNGTPRNVKAKGKLTLNKVNNEAKLGNSYVHKFPEFVAYAKPLIDEYNQNRDKAMTKGLDVEINGVELDEVDKLRAKLKEALKLKDRYRLERDNAVEARQQLEHKYSELMFHAHELQEDLNNRSNVVTHLKI